MSFAKIAQKLALWAGSPKTFLGAIVLLVIWALSGPFFKFNDTWQLIVNTSTTIITFLMVFLIQNTQNRDGAAIQTKLDELIRVSEAHNHFIGIEHLTESEVEEIRAKCEAAAKRHDRKIAETAAKQAMTIKNGSGRDRKIAEAAAKKTVPGKASSKKKAPPERPVSGS